MEFTSFCFGPGGRRAWGLLRWLDSRPLSGIWDTHNCLSAGRGIGKFPYLKPKYWAHCPQLKVQTSRERLSEPGIPTPPSNMALPESGFISGSLK